MKQKMTQNVLKKLKDSIGKAGVSQRSSDCIPSSQQMIQMPQGTLKQAAKDGYTTQGAIFSSHVQ